VFVPKLRNGEDCEFLMTVNWEALLPWSIGGLVLCVTILMLVRIRPAWYFDLLERLQVRLGARPFDGDPRVDRALRALRTISIVAAVLFGVVVVASSFMLLI